jgi:hypothetical protein
MSIIDSVEKSPKAIITHHLGSVVVADPQASAGGPNRTKRRRRHHREDRGCNFKTIELLERSVARPGEPIGEVGIVQAFFHSSQAS